MESVPQTWYSKGMQMKRKRRAFSEKFKAKVAIEAIKGIKTISQLATEYKVHPNQISTWKKQLLLNAEELFATGRKQKSKTEEDRSSETQGKKLD